MNKIVLVIVVSFIVGFAAFTDMVNKISEGKWLFALVAFKVSAICTFIFVYYFKKLKTVDEKETDKTPE